METRATSLIYKGGRVNGVQAVNADGDKITINAKETILASGRLWRQDRNAPEDHLKCYLFYGLDSDAGQGYEMARKLGAQNINMDLVKVYPQVLRPFRTTALQRLPVPRLRSMIPVQSISTVRAKRITMSAPL